MQSILRTIKVWVPGSHAAHPGAVMAAHTHKMPLGGDRWEVHQEDGRLQFMAVDDRGQALEIVGYSKGNWAKWHGYDRDLL